MPEYALIPLMMPDHFCFIFLKMRFTPFKAEYEAWSYKKKKRKKIKAYRRYV